MAERIDELVALVSESLARTVTRRRVMRNIVKAGVAAVSGATLGSLARIESVFAVTCDCNWIGGRHCTSYGYTCGSSCPSACSVCTSADGCGCPYQSGYWVVPNCTCGFCGQGYRICSDCKCPNCSLTCTCLSTCYCGQCCTPAEVAAEMDRQAALMKGVA